MMIALFLQVIGFILLIGSGIFLFAGGQALIQLRTLPALAGAILSLLLLGAGTALHFLEDIRNDTRRSADAMDYLARMRSDRVNKQQ